MLAFTMPSDADEKEKKRRERFERALKAAGISIEKERFFLDIEEGEILRKVHDEIGFENLQRELSLGCVAKVPSIRCHHNDNGSRLTYIRMMNACVAKKGMYENGTPVMGKITEAMSNPENYSETFSIYKKHKEKRLRAIVLSENNSWNLRIDGREVINTEEAGAYLEDVVGLMLDFYKSNNL